MKFGQSKPQHLRLEVLLKPRRPVGGQGRPWYLAWQGSVSTSPLLPHCRWMDSNPGLANAETPGEYERRWTGPGARACPHPPVTSEVVQGGGACPPRMQSRGFFPGVCLLHWQLSRERGDAPTGRVWFSASSGPGDRLESLIKHRPWARSWMFQSPWPRMGPGMVL